MTLQWERVDNLLADDRAERGGLRLNRSRVAGDSDCLRCLAQRQFDIEPKIVAEGKLNVLAYVCLEPAGLGG